MVDPKTKILVTRETLEGFMSLAGGRCFSFLLTEDIYELDAAQINIIIDAVKHAPYFSVIALTSQLRAKQEQPEEINIMAEPAEPETPPNVLPVIEVKNKKNN